MTYKNHLQSIKALMRKDNEETLGQKSNDKESLGTYVQKQSHFCPEGICPSGDAGRWSCSTSVASAASRGWGNKINAQDPLR